MLQYTSTNKRLTYHLTRRLMHFYLNHPLANRPSLIDQVDDLMVSVRVDFNKGAGLTQTSDNFTVKVQESAPFCQYVLKGLKGNL